MSQRIRHLRRSRRGLTMVETVVAMFIIAVACTAGLRAALCAFRDASRAIDAREARRIGDEFIAWTSSLYYRDPTAAVATIGIDPGEDDEDPFSWDDVDDMDGWSGTPPGVAGIDATWIVTASVSYATVANPTANSAVDAGAKRITIDVKHNEYPLSHRVTVRTRMRNGGRRRPPRVRRGTAYLAAVGMALLIAVISLGALLSTRALNVNERDADLGRRAAIAAEAGIHMALATLNTSPTYLTGKVAAMQTINTTIDGSNVTVKIAPCVDVVAAQRLVPAIITSVATNGLAARKATAKALPMPRPFAALVPPFFVGGTFTMAGGALTYPLGIGVYKTLGVGAGFCAGAALPFDNDAVTMKDSLQKAMYSGEFPTDAELDALAARASVLTPAGVGTINVKRRLISPRFLGVAGTLNAEGLYVLDCGGRKLVVEESRIVGTLILKNLGAGSEFKDCGLLEAAVRGYPALIVMGDIDMNLNGSNPVREGSGGLMNFNPEGLPYPYFTGSWDNDTLDNYLSAIGAPIIVTGNLTLNGDFAMTSFSVRGNCTVDGAVAASMDPWIQRSPPPELSSVLWQVDLGACAPALPGS